MATVFGEDALDRLTVIVGAAGLRTRVLAWAISSTGTSTPSSRSPPASNRSGMAPGSFNEWGFASRTLDTTLALMDAS